ncbi:MAG TPA: hypothetical protein VLC10_02425 [Patescibacteria group bacterium]|nr:hypothetical protein [Patescibacteria group bacterium]
MENPSANVVPNRPSAATKPPDRPKKLKHVLCVVIVALAAFAILLVISFLSFTQVPSVRRAAFTVGCLAAAGRPVITREFCGTSYKCLSPVLAARDAGFSCGDDLTCEGACENRKEVDIPTDSLGIETCLPQFGCNKYQGACTATRSMFSYFEKQPGCGL